MNNINFKNRKECRDAEPAEMHEYYKRFIELLTPAMEELTRAIAHYRANS